MEGLSYLINSPSKKVLEQIFLEISKVRHLREPPELIAKSLEAALKINTEQVKQLFNSVKYIIQVAVYENSNALGPLFPESFHKDLKTLILQVITAHLNNWRQDTINNRQTSLPKLKDIDWRIDVKRASDMVSNMSVPTVLVQLSLEQSVNDLQVKQDADETDAIRDNNNKIKTVNFELNKRTLETMLDGLKRIKDQLGALKS